MHLVYAVDRLGSGGAQRQVIELAAELARAERVRVTVLAYRSENFYERRVAEAGVRVATVPKRAKLDPFYPLRLRAWLLRHRVDVVHAFLLGPILWTYAAVHSIPRRRRPRFIGAERNSLDASGWLERRTKEFIFARSDRVTANSQRAALEIHRDLAVPVERIEYIPNGIDVERWEQAAELEPTTTLEPGCFHLAVIGRISPQKNHTLVLEALSCLDRELIRRWRVWFVGSDHAHPALGLRLRAEVRERRLEEIVRFSPPLREVEGFMSRLDGLLLPSLWEGFPNVVLEAMTLRVPVIATAVGAIPEILEDGSSGLVVRPACTSGLVRAMLALSRMAPAARGEMTARAKQTVNARYRMDQVAGRYLHLYRSVLAGGSPHDA